MNNPFIPKDNYITRIADRLRKEEIKRVLRNWLSRNPHCFYNGELLFSENVDKQTRQFIQESYKEVKEEM